MEKDIEAQQPSSIYTKSWYPDKTVIKPLTTISNSMSAQISAVDVKDGKILRIRPLHLDEKYKKEELRLWEIKGRGLTFAPPIKTIPHHFSYCYKNRVYSPNRIKYPLLRVDWDINSKNRKTHMRGISKLLSKIGTYTQQIRNPDSWEGWYWGSKHVWGDGSVGMMAPACTSAS